MDALEARNTYFMAPVSMVFLVRISVVVRKHRDQNDLERKDFIQLVFYITVNHQRKSGKELKQERNP